MPIYVYKCEKCATQEEGFFNLSEPAPTHCEQPMVKQLQPSLIAFQTQNGNLYRHSVRDAKWTGGGRPKPKVIGKGHGMGGRRKPPTMERVLESGIPVQGKIIKTAKEKTK